MKMFTQKDLTKSYAPDSNLYSIDIDKLMEAIIELSAEVNDLNNEIENLKSQLDSHEQDIFIHNGKRMFF